MGIIDILSKVFFCLMKKNYRKESRVKKINEESKSFRVIIFSLGAWGIFATTLLGQANAQEIEKWGFEAAPSVGLSYRHAPNRLENSVGLDSLFNFLYSFRIEVLFDLMAVSPSGKQLVGVSLGLGAFEVETSSGVGNSRREEEYTLFDIPFLFVYRYQTKWVGIRPFVGTILEFATASVSVGGELISGNVDRLVPDATLGLRIQFGKAVSYGYIEAAYIYSPDNPRYLDDEHSYKFAVGWTIDIIKTIRNGDF